MLASESLYVDDEDSDEDQEGDGAEEDAEDGD